MNLHVHPWRSCTLKISCHTPDSIIKWRGNVQALLLWNRKTEMVWAECSTSGLPNPFFFNDLLQILRGCILASLWRHVCMHCVSLSLVSIISWGWHVTGVPATAAVIQLIILKWKQVADLKYFLAFLKATTHLVADENTHSPSFRNTAAELHCEGLPRWNKLNSWTETCIA